MYIPKRYGESKVNKCPFCGNAAYYKNNQDVPVCKDHKDQKVNDMKCACGSWLDMKQGKFGVFYVCMHCGPVNMKKALDINSEGTGYKIQKKSTSSVSTSSVPTSFVSTSSVPTVQSQKSPTQYSFQKIQPKKKEITISSEELDFI
ncbi:MAG: hypothetical protein WC254_06935 [Candidatus Woesearchaeota archaeon]|jgi:hypothetical protein